MLFVDSVELLSEDPDQGPVIVPFDRLENGNVIRVDGQIMIVRTNQYDYPIRSGGVAVDCELAVEMEVFIEGSE
jgi:hypothetical protein